MPNRCILLGSKARRSATGNGFRLLPTNNLRNRTHSDVAVLLRPQGFHGVPTDHPLKGIINELSRIPP